MRLGLAIKVFENLIKFKTNSYISNAPTYF